MTELKVVKEAASDDFINYMKPLWRPEWPCIMYFAHGTRNSKEVYVS